MGGFAWVTLATNDSYSLGALVLANSLKNVGTAQQLVVLVTPGVTDAMREKLRQVFNLVQEVNILDSKDEANLRLLKRPELGITFTKLHCWRLTQFDKCVFLDADTLVLQNCDELFEREELSAAPDVGWPDCFNSGVFVYRPSNETYESLVKFALERGSFDGGDQGLLNLYFSDWATKDISKHLPFIYNLCSTALYSYLPAFKQFGADAKIVHFIGATKPWLQYFNTETRKVQPSNDLKHLENVLQQWWNIFCTLIHPNLTSEMAGLAGAFAQLTLGAPRTSEQSALDDHLRRQGWEIGNIDYLGKDSFDNIWSKICKTLGTDPQPQAPVQETASQALESDSPQFPFPPKQVEAPQPVSATSLASESPQPETVQPGKPASPVTEPVPTPASPQPTPPSPQPIPATPEPIIPASPQPTPASPQPTPDSPQPTPESPQPTPASPQPTPASPQATPASPQPQPTPASPQPTPASPPPTPASPQPQPTPASPQSTPASPQPQPTPASPQPTPASPPPTPASPQPQPTPASPQPTPASPQPTPASPQSTPASPQPQPTPASPQPTPASPQPTPTSPQPTPASPQPTPASPQPTPASPQPTPASPQPVPTSPQTPASPQPAPTSPQPAAGPQQPQTETPKPEKPTPSSPKSVAPKPESTPVATKSVKEEAPKSPEASESKQLPESAQSASGASPTPPPRKGSGGAKKTTKSKK